MSSILWQCSLKEVFVSIHFFNESAISLGTARFVRAIITVTELGLGVGD